MKILWLLFISLLFNGCIGGKGRLYNTVNYLNNQIENDEYYTKQDVKKSNDYYKVRNMQNDGMVGKTIHRDDGKLEVHKSGTIHLDKYEDFYYILNKNRKIIGWEFLHCDKRTINFDNPKSYEKCLKNTRVTKAKDNIYRIGVNKTFLIKYGYKYDNERTFFLFSSPDKYNKETEKLKTTKEDDKKIIMELTREKNICNNGYEILKKEYWGSRYNVRYYIECK